MPIPQFTCTHRNGLVIPHLACDTCGERIEDHGLALAQIFPDGGVRIVHKNVDGRACDSKRACAMWMPVDVYILHLLTNLGFDRKEAEAHAETWAMTI